MEDVFVHRRLVLAILRSLVALVRGVDGCDRARRRTRARDRPARVSRRRADAPGAVLMAAWLQLVVLVLILVAAYRPLGDYLAWALTRRGTLRVERAIYPARRRRPRRRAAVDRLRDLVAGVLGRLGVAAVRAAAGAAVAAALARAPAWSRLRRSTPRPRSSRTRTGSPTRVSRRWATSSRWRASPCRTSCPPRSGSPSRWRSIRGFTPDASRRRSGTSGRTWSARPSGCCSRSRSSAPSCWSPKAWCRTSTGAPGHHRSGGDPVDPGRAGRLAGSDQGARDERRRVLQRELGASVREPEPVHEPAPDRS